MRVGGAVEREADQRQAVLLANRQAVPPGPVPFAHEQDAFLVLDDRPGYLGDSYGFLATPPRKVAVGMSPRGAGASPDQYPTGTIPGGTRWKPSKKLSMSFSG